MQKIGQESTFEESSSSTLSSTRPTNQTKSQRTTADYSLSCAECRRLKLKCSRQQWPCETCIKRGIAHLCPDGIQKKERSRVPSTTVPSKQHALSSNSNTLAGVTADTARQVDIGQGRGEAALYNRLESLEKKIDRLIGASPFLATQSAPLSNGSLHDLASIATDHYALEDGHLLSMQVQDDATRQRHGTLTMDADGRAHYMGSNAHSMYLAQEKSDNRRVSFREDLTSRPGSPTPIDMEAAAHLSASRERAETVPGASPEGNTPSTIESQPAQLVWATPGFRSPHSSTAIWNLLKPVLPTQQTALRMVNVYYATVTFMFHPITRSDFDETIWNVFYSPSTASHYTPPPDFHPHKLALLYSMLSLGVLLDVQRPQRDIIGRTLYSCAWNALALSNFTEATSLEAILALMHINMYLTWRRGGKYAESAYPLLGTMMRMAISTGLHRDPALFNLDEQQREKRRRVFWDVQCSEVFRAFAFCRPPALCDRHVDTRLPSQWQSQDQDGDEVAVVPFMPKLSSKREGIFHAFKCKQIQIVNRMLDECLCQNSSFQTTMHFDKKLRQMFKSVPIWLLPTLVDFDSWSSTANEDLEKSYNDVATRDEMILEMQRHTTLLNHHQALLLLHRGWFSQALQRDEGSPGRQINVQTSESEQRLSTSIEAVNESASNMINITISAWCKYPALVIRWAFFWNSIFSAAVCRALFILKCFHRSSESEKAWIDLRRAIELFSKAVDGWAPLESPLGILQRLNKRAEVVMNGKVSEEEEARESLVESEVDDLELIGDERRKSKRKLQDDTKSSKKRRNAQDEEQTSQQSQQSIPDFYSSLLPSTDPSSGPTFDMSSTQDDSSAFMAMELEQPPLFPSTMLSSSFTNNVSLDNSGVPSSSASASQLIQMLSSGLSWDDVSSWNDLIVDL